MSKPSQKKPDEPITIEAISIIPIGGEWVFLRYFIQGDKVVKVLPSEPDVRLAARGHFQTAAANMMLSDKGGT